MTFLKSFVQYVCSLSIRRTIIVVLTCIALSVLSSVIISRRISAKAVMAATADISSQIRSHGRLLPPGGRGMIRVPQVPANELIVLPPYSHKSDIQRELPHHSAAFRERLFRATASDVTCPALVWAKDDNIVAICSFRPSVAMQLTVKRIDLKTASAIGIVKELRSENEFLSLKFEDSEGS